MVGNALCGADNITGDGVITTAVNFDNACCSTGHFSTIALVLMNNILTQKGPCLQAWRIECTNSMCDNVRCEIAARFLDY